MNTAQRLVRSRTDVMLGGVASGIARYVNVDPVLIRLLFVVLAVSGPGLFIYPILWVVMPLEPSTPQNNAASAGQVFVAEGTPTQRLRIDPMSAAIPDPEQEIPIQNIGETRSTAPDTARTPLVGWALIGIGGFVLLQMIWPGVGSLLVPAILVGAGVWLLRK